MPLTHTCDTAGELFDTAHEMAKNQNFDAALRALSTAYRMVDSEHATEKRQREDERVRLHAELEVIRHDLQAAREHREELIERRDSLMREVKLTITQRDQARSQQTFWHRRAQQAEAACVRFKHEWDKHGGPTGGNFGRIVLEGGMRYLQDQIGELREAITDRRDRFLQDVPQKPAEWIMELYRFAMDQERKTKGGK